ncbi:Argonaute siRNA chaperone complex subunit Arb1-domain-containing protein [Gongronella butleri]|nr:Argonaute siRNA chaperone complex subunit Arb1-domain-containing protein [Gongronella butleri]
MSDEEWDDERRMDLIDRIFGQNQEIVTDLDEEAMEQLRIAQEKMSTGVIMPEDLATPAQLMRAATRGSSAQPKAPKQPKQRTSEQEEQQSSPSGSGEAEGDEDDADDLSDDTPLVEPKKKKKKKKKKAKNLPAAGTELAADYEERYKEDPVANPFDLSHPLSHRVEHAIFKYRRNHRFTEETKNLFEDYLRFGGIETGPNSYLGGGKLGLSAMDALDEAPEETVGVDVADIEELDEGAYISFSEVTRVYLGNNFISKARFISVEDFSAVAPLVDAVLRYLEIRKVCPDYEEDIAKAREWAALAKVELPKCKRVGMQLPGAFNDSCVILFGGESQSIALEPSDATTALPDWVMGNSKMMQAAATMLEGLAISGNATEKAKKAVAHVIPNPDALKVVQEHDQIMLKLKHIHTPVDASTDDKTEEANGQNDTTNDKKDDAKGKKDDTKTDMRKVTFGYLDDVTFEATDDNLDMYLEKSIVDDMFEGMVLLVTIKKLSNGLWYIDRSHRVYPSIYMVDQFADPDDE